MAAPLTPVIAHPDTNVFIMSKNEVTRVTKGIYEDKKFVGTEEVFDEVSNLPVWETAESEITFPDGTSIVASIQIVSEKPPVLSKRTEHRVTGGYLIVSPYAYLRNGNLTKGTSFIIPSGGSLVPVNAASAPASKPFLPSKD